MTPKTNHGLLVQADQIIEVRKDLVHRMLYDRLTPDARASAHALWRHLYKDLKRLQVEIGPGINVLRPSQEVLRLLEDARRLEKELREGVLE